MKTFPCTTVSLAGAVIAGLLVIEWPHVSTDFKPSSKLPSLL